MKRWQRITDHWVYGGFAFSFVLLILLVPFAGSLELLEILLWLHLPAYMWHQYEEHDDDRFRDFVDRIFGEGILRQNAIFVINVLGVWMLFSVFILIALLFSPGWGIGVAYLTLVNALVHLAQFIKLRCYNPGLITALILFVPLGGFCLWEAFKEEEFTVW
ncbi:MAG: HXXEE domain-containing protein, partial [Verrucomicrobiota bacterium]